MNFDLIKQFAPIVFVCLWIFSVLRNKSSAYAGATLFFTGFVAFSQNFAFIYRQLFQFLQAVMAIYCIFDVLRQRRIFRFNYLFLVLLSSILVSLMFSQFDADANAQVLNIVVAIAVVNYLYQMLRSDLVLGKVMSFVGLLAVVESIFGLLEFVGNLGVRSEGTFANPNYFALFLGVGFCIVYESRRGTRRNVSMALLLIGILISGSRAGFLLPVLSVSWSLHRMRKTSHVIIYGAVGAVALGALILSGVTRLSDTASREGSDAERVIFARIALRMANDHPLTGVGWGRYISEFGHYSSAAEEILTGSGEVDVSNQERRVTHNDLVRILAELGWPSFFLAIFSLMRGGFKIWRFGESSFAYFVPIWLGTVSFSFAHNNLNGAFFWFLFVVPFHLYGRIVDARTGAMAAKFASY
jgi:hypothetical protein